MHKVVWRFNLAAGVDSTEFFAWLRRHVWASSAEFGCATTAFRLSAGDHAWSTEAVWPSATARAAWSASPGFAALPNWPGTDTPWGAQADMQLAIYEPLVDIR